MVRRKVEDSKFTTKKATDIKENGKAISLTGKEKYPMIMAPTT